MHLFLLLGIMIILGFLGAKFSNRIKVPHVVGYILVGVLIGSSFLDIIGSKTVVEMELISSLALALIGFAIGGEFDFSEIRKLGISIPVITIFEAMSAFLLVLGAVFLLTKNWPVALIFGALAAATAPAATVDVLWQYHSRGPLTTTIFAVVGLDDAIALIIYAFAASVAKALLIGSEKFSFSGMARQPSLEILGSLALGLSIGLILHLAIKKINKENELLIVCLGVIFLCAGISIIWHFSLILTSMALGVTLVNLSPRNKAAFDSISRLTPPIYLLFFILVGARLQLGALPKLGLLGMIYISMRVTGKFIGSYFGAFISSAPVTVRKYLGFGLMSQAGVAIGLAIDASHTFARIGPAGADLGLLAINVIAATTFVFQIFGPPMTKYAIFKAGEAEYSEKAVTADISTDYNPE